MKRLRIAIVAENYDAAVEGGRYCRFLAGRLVRYHDVTVLTTRAGEPAGESSSGAGGVETRRFPIDASGNLRQIEELARRVLEGDHSPGGKARWLKQAPCSSALLKYIEDHREAYDTFLFYSYRAPATFFGLPAVFGRAVLLPAAGREPELYLAVFDDLFREARRIACLTPEEHSLITRRFFDLDLDARMLGTAAVPPPEPASAAPDPHWDALRERLGGCPFILCTAAADAPRDTAAFLEMFLGCAPESCARDLKLLLAGSDLASLPLDPRVIAAEGIPDATCLRALHGARFRVLPSGDSVVGLGALESWSLGRPVLANGRSAAVRGLCARSNGGLWYTNSDEFREAMELMAGEDGLVETLGAQGQSYVARAHSLEEFDRRAIEAVTLNKP